MPVYARANEGSLAIAWAKHSSPRFIPSDVLLFQKKRPIIRMMLFKLSPAMHSMVMKYVPSQLPRS
jgi:hypothetical protein